MLWETYRTVGLAGQCFMLGDLYPSKSGLTHKYIVKHIGRSENLLYYNTCLNRADSVLRSSL